VIFTHLLYFRIYMYLHLYITFKTQNFVESTLLNLCEFWWLLHKSLFKIWLSYKYVLSLSSPIFLYHIQSAKCCWICANSGGYCTKSLFKTWLLYMYMYVMLLSSSHQWKQLTLINLNTVYSGLTSILTGAYCTLVIYFMR